MGFSFPTFYEYIVYVDFHIPPYLLVEHLIHQSLIVGTCILQPKRRDFVAIWALASDKHSFLLIFFLH